MTKLFYFVLRYAVEHHVILMLPVGMSFQQLVEAIFLQNVFWILPPWSGRQLFLPISTGIPWTGTQWLYIAWINGWLCFRKQKHIKKANKTDVSLNPTIRTNKTSWEIYTKQRIHLIPKCNHLVTKIFTMTPMS